MEFENENGTWSAGMVTQYNPTNDQYAAFFPSDHTSRQMIKTIALFLEHLCTIQQQQLYTMVSSYPLIYKPLIFFQLKTHTVCSRQTITSLHILCNAVCHGNIHQLKTNVVFIYCTNGHIQLRVWPWIYLMRFMVNLSSAPSPSRLAPPSNCSFTQLLPLNITHVYSVSCVRRSMHLTREDFTSLQST